VDSADNLYVTDSSSHTIRKITPQGVVTTVAGTPRVSGTNDGPAATALFNQPWGLSLDPQTNIYVADTGNNTIRKITPDGMVTTLAGRPGVAGSADGTNDSATFYTPSSVVMNNEGALYVSEWDGQRIRKLTPSSTDWVVTTIAGSGSTGSKDGKGSGARFSHPCGLAMDHARNILYIADEYSSLVRTMTPEGIVSTLAGGASYGSIDGTGTAARFNYPHFGSVDSAGNLYVADMRNFNIRRVTPDGVVTTLGGLAGANGAVDGTGRNARFSWVRKVAVDSLGNLYVTDADNYTIRKGVPFAITTWPQGQTVRSGTPVALTVAAAGDNGPFSYQWLFNSVPLPGETNTTLALGPAAGAHSGLYSVMVSNAVGNWITIDASVRVLVPPVLQTPQLLTNGTLRLLFQDADGGVPYDLSKVALQWRTNLPRGTDTNWITLTAPCYLDNGFAVIEDTNSVRPPSRFYRILEW
jgi:sugar lactone lactonase YvrE